MSGKPESCEHFSAIRKVTPGANGCENCLALGVKWTQLRICLTCGHVGCCEDSPHAHALQHFKATGHPMIASFEPADTWGWCYIDRRYFDPLPRPVPKRQPQVVALLARGIRRLRGLSRKG